MPTYKSLTNVHLTGLARDLARRADEGKPIRIGVTQTISGPLAYVGTQHVMGARVAAKLVNDAGGIEGRKVELVIADTGGNPAVQWQLDHVVGRSRGYGGGAGLRRERGGDPRRGGNRPCADIVRLSQDFECPGTIGQAADEAAFLKGGNQPVDPGLRLEVERILHFLERRGYAALFETGLDEPDQLMLFARQHRHSTPAVRDAGTDVPASFSERMRNK